MKILKTDVERNPFIGMFLQTNETHSFLPPTAPPHLVGQVQDALGTQVVKLFISQSPLIGIFSVVNSNGAVLSKQAEAQEISVFKKLGLNACFMDKLAPGNTVLCNDYGAVVPKLVERKQAQEIQDCLGVAVLRAEFDSIQAIGSGCVANNYGLLAYNELDDGEIKTIAEHLKVKSSARATNNLGTPYNKYGLVANSKGAIVGSLTTGFELQRIYSTLSKE
ncbi:translation initiation factor IF-6 [Candidatus Micrarchaeota archaeon]|nr:translation initiation factor IF-6 [Candidatus Micrarchaeota archaeon]